MREPRTSGGATSALYIGTIIESEPTPIPLGDIRRLFVKRAGTLRDESTSEDCIVASTACCQLKPQNFLDDLRDCSCLDYDTQNENCGSD